MGARREARDALAAAGLRPRKRWGQHFLCDPARGAPDRRRGAARRRARRCSRSVPGSARSPTCSPRAPRRLYLVEIDRGLAARLRRALRRRSRTSRSSSATCSRCRSTELVAEPATSRWSRTCPTTSRRRSSSACSRCATACARAVRDAAARGGASAWRRPPGGDGRAACCRCWCRPSPRCASPSACRGAASCRRRRSTRRSSSCEIAARPRVPLGDAAALRGGRARRLRPAPEDAAQRARRPGGRRAASTRRRSTRLRARRRRSAGARAETLDLADFARLARPRSAE